jgi:hypothetical protein
MIRRTAVVRTRMPGGVGGAAPRGAPLSRLQRVARQPSLDHQYQRAVPGAAAPAEPGAAPSDDKVGPATDSAPLHADSRRRQQLPLAGRPVAQQRPLRASCEASKHSTVPTLPAHSHATRRAKPERAIVPLAEHPRLSLITSTCRKPRARAISTSPMRADGAGAQESTPPHRRFRRASGSL